MRSICGDCLDKRKGDNYEVSFSKEIKFIVQTKNKKAITVNKTLKICR